MELKTKKRLTSRNTPTTFRFAGLNLLTRKYPTKNPEDKPIQYFSIAFWCFGGAKN